MARAGRGRIALLAEGKNMLPEARRKPGYRRSREVLTRAAAGGSDDRLLCHTTTDMCAWSHDVGFDTTVRGGPPAGEVNNVVGTSAPESAILQPSLPPIGIDIFSRADGDHILRRGGRSQDLVPGPALPAAKTITYSWLPAGDTKWL